MARRSTLPAPAQPEEDPHWDESRTSRREYLYFQAAEDALERERARHKPGPAVPHPEEGNPLFAWFNNPSWGGDATRQAQRTGAAIIFAREHYPEFWIKGEWIAAKKIYTSLVREGRRGLREGGRWTKFTAAEQAQILKYAKKTMAFLERHG